MQRRLDSLGETDRQCRGGVLAAQGDGRVHPLGQARGFTLVELMVVVAIVGVLASMAIYGVRSYVQSSRSAEARVGVSRIAKDAVTAYGKQKMSGAVVALGSFADDPISLCQSADAVPANPTLVASAKYQSSPADWGGSMAVGWTCLGFTMEDPQYFQYDYNANGTNALGDSFEALAHGDLDADGAFSTFRVSGNIQRDGTAQVLVVAPGLEEVSPLE